MRRILWLSNGHGEDRIASTLIRAWHSQSPHDQHWAIPLVGPGQAFGDLAVQVSLLGERFSPPSQGFAYLHPLKLWGDLRAGLMGPLHTNLQALRHGHWDQLIAVGDIVPVLAAQWHRAPLAFVACALSDYYTAGRSCFDPLQIALLRRRQSPVFARDALSADNLKRRGVNAFALGNPMQDDVASAQAVLPFVPTAPVIGLLPGSHDDMPHNLPWILHQLSELWDQPWIWAVVCAQAAHQHQAAQLLQKAGWQQQGQVWKQQQAQLYLLTAAAFGSLLKVAQAVVGLAGTANEQAVAQGVPVIAFAGPGLQYNWAFGEAQQRLLGPALHFLGDPHPHLLRYQVLKVMTDRRYQTLAQQISQERFGPPGAADRIVACLLARS